MGGWTSEEDFQALEVGSGLLEKGIPGCHLPEYGQQRHRLLVGTCPGPVDTSPCGKGCGQPCKTQVAPIQVVQPPSQTCSQGGGRGGEWVAWASPLLTAPRLEPAPAFLRGASTPGDAAGTAPKACREEPEACLSGLRLGLPQPEPRCKQQPLLSTCSMPAVLQAPPALFHSSCMVSWLVAVPSPFLRGE